MSHHTLQNLFPPRVHSTIPVMTHLSKLVSSFLIMCLQISEFSNHVTFFHLLLPKCHYFVFFLSVIFAQLACSRLSRNSVISVASSSFVLTGQTKVLSRPVWARNLICDLADHALKLKRWRCRRRSSTPWRSWSHWFFFHRQDAM